MHLRPLRSDDRPFLLEILHDTPEFSRAEIACAIEVIDEAITQPEKGDYRCLVAVDDADRPLGYACFGPTPMTDSTWDLYWIAIGSGARRGGIGRALLALAESDVIAQGGRAVRREASARRGY